MAVATNQTKRYTGGCISLCLISSSHVLYVACILSILFVGNVKSDTADLPNMAEMLKGLDKSTFNPKMIQKMLSQFSSLGFGSNNDDWKSVITSLSKELQMDIPDSVLDKIKPMLASLMSMIRLMPGMDKLLVSDRATSQLHHRILKQRLGDKARNDFVQQFRSLLGENIDTETIEEHIYQMKGVLETIQKNQTTDPKQLMHLITENALQSLDSEHKEYFRSQMQQMESVLMDMLDPANQNTDDHEGEL